MKFRRFRSQPPVSPYAPMWDFRVGTSLCEDIDTNSLSEFLISKEKDVKKLMKKNLKEGSYKVWRKRVRAFSDRRNNYK